MRFSVVPPMSDSTEVTLGTGAVCAADAMTRDYRNDMQSALGLLRLEEIARGADVLRAALRRDGSVFAFGNGGSASTASHFVVDLGKLARCTAGCRTRAIALADNAPWMTAVANDLSFEECFAEPLRVMLRPGDVTVGISASGDSENMVRAFSVAREVGATRLALVGFSGGRLGEMASHKVWVDSDDYGVVESAHLFIVHAMIRAVRDVDRGVAGQQDGAFVSASRRVARASVMPALPADAGVPGFGGVEVIP